MKGGYFLLFNESGARHLKRKEEAGSGGGGGLFFHLWKTIE